MSAKYGMLQSPRGQFLSSLTPAEVQDYEALAQQGFVDRSEKKLKGRIVPVFTQKVFTKIPDARPNVKAG